MKRYIQTIPFNVFAAAIALSSTANAQQTNPTDNNVRGQQYQNQESALRTSSTANLTPEQIAQSRPIAVSSLMGMDINAASNEKIGEIDEIIIHSQTGELIAVVVSTGGFFGMGQDQAYISPRDLEVNGERSMMKANFSKDQLANTLNTQKGKRMEMDPVPQMNRTAHQTQARTERTQQQVSNASSGRELAVSTLMGMTVENRQGDNVGKVEEVFVNPMEYTIEGVVISTGKFLGMGGRDTLFSIRQLSIDTRNERILLDYTREQIQSLPEYKADDQSVFTGLNDRMNRFASNDNRNARNEPNSNVRNDSNRAIRNESRYDDRSTELTVFNQGNSSEEIKMTASIRSAIRDDKSLSSRADNVTIITNKGKVMLRGDVDSISEKSTVEGIAQNKAGRANVTSELIVRAR